MKEHDNNMQKRQRRPALAMVRLGLILCGFFLLLPDMVAAIPVSTGANPYRPHTAPVDSNLAIFGYDPVAYFIEGRAVKGREQFEHEFENVRWRFASEQNRRAFIDAPQRYVPAYGGYCAVCIVEDEGLFDADPRFWSMVQGKLYFNSDARAREKFRRKAKPYIQWADEVWAKLAQGVKAGDSAKLVPAAPTRRVAMFPIISANQGGSELVIIGETRDKIEAYLKTYGSLQLTHDFSASPADGRWSDEDVWAGNVVLKKPVLESVMRLAAEFEVDVVVMAFVDNNIGSDTSMKDISRVDLYVIDPGQGRMVKESGQLLHLRNVLEKAFYRFNAAVTRVALFPIMVGTVGTDELIVRGTTTERIKTYIESDGVLHLAYDFSIAPPANAQWSSQDVWSGNVLLQEPVVKSVTRLAKGLEVQVVVMAYIDNLSGHTHLTDLARVDLYVLNPQQGRMVKESGQMTRLPSMLDKAFSRFNATGADAAASETAIAPGTRTTQ